MGAKLLTKAAALKLFYPKSQVFTKSEVYSKSETYARGEVYSRSESDARFLGTDGTAADAELLDGFDTGTVSGPNTVYISDANGDLPANTVDAAAIDDPTRVISIPVHSLDEAFDAGGPDPQKMMTGGMPVLAFDDTVDERIALAFTLPDDAVPSTPLVVFVRWSAAATTGALWLRSEIRGPVDGQPAEGASPGHTLLVAAPSATSGRLKSSEAGVLLAQPGRLIVFELSRDATSDTMPGDAFLHAIDFRYVAVQ